MRREVPPSEANERGGMGLRKSESPVVPMKPANESPKELVEGRGGQGVESKEGKMAETLNSGDISTRLDRIANMARTHRGQALRSIHHAIDLDWLKEAYRRTRKDGAVGVDSQTGADYAQDLEANLQSLLDRFKLAHMREEFAGTLSGGQRKLLEMARALMTDPALIMLDEPMAGVNPALTQSLLGHVKALRDEGRTVVFVEHDMDVVRDISDWVVVMAEGSIIAEGPHEAIGANQTVIDAYLGTSHDAPLDLGGIDPEGIS